MQPSERVRRRTNGTIDIDSYRQEALFLRAQTRTEFLKRVGRVARPLIGTVAILVAYAVFLLREAAPPATASLGPPILSVLGD